MARSAVCSDVLARSARHDMPLARSALTLRALTAQPLTSAVRPRRKPHRVLVMPCDHQPTWLDHSASTINVVEVPRLLLPVSVDPGMPVQGVGAEGGGLRVPRMGGTPSNDRLLRRRLQVKVSSIASRRIPLAAHRLNDGLIVRLCGAMHPKVEVSLAAGGELLELRVGPKMLHDHGAARSLPATPRASRRRYVTRSCAYSFDPRSKNCLKTSSTGGMA